MAAYGPAFQLPLLSACGATMTEPSFRFHRLLIKKDMQISCTRHSDKTNMAPFPHQHHPVYPAYPAYPVIQAFQPPLSALSDHHCA